MSTSATPPEDTAGPGGDPKPARPATPRRPSVHHRPDADFELMLLLRRASRALELRNRVVPARRAAARPAREAAAGADQAADASRDPAHPA